MNPVITELDEETGEWEIVSDHDDEQSTLDQLIESMTGDGATRMAADFTESDHPRSDDGKFSKGGMVSRGAGNKAKAAKKSMEQYGKKKEPAETEPIADHGQVDHDAFKADFDRAYAKYEQGTHGTSLRGMVSFHDLRAEMPHYSREEFDQGVRKLREDDHYTAEPPHKQTQPGVREAGIQEGKDNLVWISRK